MNRSLNKVYHFQGTESAWQQHITNGDWADSIVFGLVRDYETDKVSNRIYAGKDSLQTDYEYKSSITDDSAIHQITGESPIQLNPNDEYVAVAVTADSSNNITINSSIQLALPFTIDSSNSSIPTGLTTDAYVKDAISQSLDWEII